MGPKKNYLDISMFLTTGIIILVLSTSFYAVNHNIKMERDAVEKEAELQELSYQLANASDFLTSAVRRFVVTLNPLHLRKYWTEIKVTKTREKIISRLKQLETPLNEFDLLNAAKNYSDDLMNSEIRAMKLILRVYEVPDDQMEVAIRDYHLSQDEEKLTSNEKVNLAKEIVYDKEYENGKEKIMAPIAQFGTTMQERIKKETDQARKNTNLASLFLLGSIIATAIYLVYISWFILFRVSIPLKKYISSIETEEGKADDELKNSKAIGLIKEVLTTIKKNT